MPLPCFALRQVSEADEGLYAQVMAVQFACDRLSSCPVDGNGKLQTNLTASGFNSLCASVQACAGGGGNKISLSNVDLRFLAPCTHAHEPAKSMQYCHSGPHIRILDLDPCRLQQSGFQHCECGSLQSLMVCLVLPSWPVAVKEINL